MNKQRGFTLVETLLYIAIIGGILTFTVNFSLTILDGQQKARSYQEAQQNARFSVDRISQEIRSALDVNVSSSTFLASPGALSLSHRDSAKGPTIFDVSESRIRMRQGTTTSVFLTSDRVVVSSLIFEDLSFTNRTKNIRVSLSLYHSNPESSSILNGSTTLQSSVTLRSAEDLP